MPPWGRGFSRNKRRNKPRQERKDSRGADKEVKEEQKKVKGERDMSRSNMGEKTKSKPSVKRNGAKAGMERKDYPKRWRRNKRNRNSGTNVRSPKRRNRSTNR